MRGVRGRTPPRGSRHACTSTRRSARRRAAAPAPLRRALGALGLADDVAVPVDPNARGRQLSSTCVSRERPGSRSSMRSRNRAPAPRANSQASSAVRRLPTCSSPVGVGAKRPSALAGAGPLGRRSSGTSATLTASSVKTRLYGAAAMADEEASEDAGTSAPPLPCAPCRGTGKLISGAGGSPHEVPCPWCEGSGMTIPGHDAQAARREGGGRGACTGEAGGELTRTHPRRRAPGDVHTASRPRSPRPRGGRRRFPPAEPEAHLAVERRPDRHPYAELDDPHVVRDLAATVSSTLSPRSARIVRSGGSDARTTFASRPPGSAATVRGTVVRWSSPVRRVAPRRRRRSPGSARPRGSAPVREGSTCAHCCAAD